MVTTTFPAIEGKQPRGTAQKPGVSPKQEEIECPLWYHPFLLQLQPSQMWPLVDSSGWTAPGGLA